MNYQDIQDLLNQAFENFRENTAISCGERHLTYGDLEDRSNKLANFLISSGAERGSIVAIMSQDAVEVITATIAILKAGCVFVTLAPHLPEKRLNAIVSDIYPQWFVVDSKVVRKLRNLEVIETLKPQVICVDEERESEDFQDNLNVRKDYADYANIEKQNVHVEPDDMCYIYFTSGSTGKPKGIAGRQKALAHYIQWEIKTFGIGESTKVSQLTTPVFDAFLRDVFVPLCAGGTICIPEEIDTIIDARKLLDWIDSQQINIIHCVPSLFRSLLNEDLDPTRLSNLRYILLAGEPLLPADVIRWMDVYGQRIQLVNLYGASETTMTKFFYFVKPSDRERRSIPIGKPMEGATAVVVDDQGRVCSAGMVGEIYIRTPYRTLGYYRQQALTNEVFIQNPFSNNPNDIVYKTGDLGRILEDGNYEYLGRIDRQVKIRGVRIELAEIENQLRLHPAIKDVVIVDGEDSNSNKYLCAYVVLNQSLDSGALRDFLSQYLPESMVPSVFVQIDTLPRTLSGKVDRRSLPAPQQEPTRTFVAPRTPLEEKLASIWAQVLNLERVGINDHFFELGGHSLLATQLVSRAGRAFQVELPLRVLLELPTLAGMAQSLETLLWAAETARVPQSQTESGWEEGEL